MIYPIARLTRPASYILLLHSPEADSCNSCYKLGAKREMRAPKALISCSTLERIHFWCRGRELKKGSWRGSRPVCSCLLVTLLCGLVTPHPASSWAVGDKLVINL